MIEQFITGRLIKDQSCYKQFPPEVDGEWMFVLVIVMGFFISASLSGEFYLRWLPSLWMLDSIFFLYY